MFKFNNDNIFTGQIKQVLSSFNLPKYRVYTIEQQQYHDYAVEYNREKTAEYKIDEEKNIVGTVTKEQDINHMRYVYYIKDNKIQYCIVSTNTYGRHLFTWVDTGMYYSFNQEITNYTKTLKINNNIYDYYTHEYLGDYLRFLRDYNHINLMSLYNCFSDRVCTSLSYSWTLRDTEQVNPHKIVFDTSDTNYKIYMLPVKLFKKYTIAVDSATGIEVCCGVFGKYQDTRTKLKYIPELTYKKYSKTIFNQPVLYDLLTTINDQTETDATAELAQNEQDLKLFIKVPTTNDSSIVVLEGDYRNYNDSKLVFKATEWQTKTSWTSGSHKFYLDTTNSSPVITSPKENDCCLCITSTSKVLYKYTNSIWVAFKKFTDMSNNVDYGATLPNLLTGKQYNSYDLFLKTDSEDPKIQTKATTGTLYIANNVLRRIQNTAAINFDTTVTTESGKVNDFSTFKPISALQLLRANTKVQYPFADRLIEYLTDNAITPEETILDNVRRLTKVINLNKKYPDEKCKLWDDTNKKFIIGNGKLLSNLEIPTSGEWAPVIRPLLYEKFNENVDANINDINHDILGYVDKDIEKYYRANTGNTDAKENYIYTTISNIDLYTDKNGLYSDDGEDRE